eukprot:403345170
MEQIYQDKSCEIKFSYSHPNILGVLSGRDIQVFELKTDQSNTNHLQQQPQFNSNTLKQYDDSGNINFNNQFSQQTSFSQKFKLRVVVELDQVQSFEWAKIKNQHFLAAAHQNGKISFVNVNHSKLQSQSSMGTGSLVYTGKVEKEFFTGNMIQNPRQCNTIAWNPHEQNIFAAGYEQVKNESSLLIWDINRTQNPNYNKIRDTEKQIINNFVGDQTVAKLESRPKPQILFEPRHTFQKINDDIFCLKWFPNSSTELIYGTDKYIRICDTRELQNLSQYEDVHSNQVQAIQFDPFDNIRFASFSEDTIKVFDLRNFKKPLYIIRDESKKEDEQNHFLGFEWSQVRPNVILSFSKKSRDVDVWQLQNQGLEVLKNNQSLSDSTVIQNLQLIQNPVRKIIAQDDVIGICSTPKQLQDKDKIFLYTKNGYIEEQVLNESNRFIFDMSARGHICMSGKQKKTIHSIPFFDSVINYEQLKTRYLQDEETMLDLNQYAYKYNEEGNAFIDTQNIIANRIKAGYFLDTPQRNFTLSLRFRGYNDFYQSQNAIMNSQSVGLKIFWNYINKLQENEGNNIQFVDGILSQLDIGISEGCQRLKDIELFFKSPQNDLEKSDDLLGFKIYTGIKRQNILQFCGWTDYLKAPPPGLGTQQVNTALFQEIKKQNIQTYNDLNRICTQIDDEEKHIQGSISRTCILSALHFDFQRAMGFSSHADPLPKYREDATNSQVLNFVLRNCKKIMSSIGQQMTEQQAQEKLKQLLEDCQLSNFSQDFPTKFGLIINYFDQIGLICRYFNQQLMLQALKEMVIKGIEEGSLETIVLIGLKSPYLFHLLQNYVDKHGDIQSAAYISSYYYTLMNQSNQQPDKRVNTFIQEYRTFLNQLQLWYHRANFDQMQALFSLLLIKTKTRQQDRLLNQIYNRKPIETQLVHKFGINNDPFDKKSYENSAKCFYCNHGFSVKSSVKNYLQISKQKRQVLNSEALFSQINSSSKMQSNHPEKEKTISRLCVECGKSTPNCSVCLQPIGILNPFIELKSKAPTSAVGFGTHSVINQNENQNSIQMKRELEMWFLWCQKCKHGGHTQHILEWFKNQPECSVSNCDCRCNIISNE